MAGCRMQDAYTQPVERFGDARYACLMSGSPPPLRTTYRRALRPGVHLFPP